MEAGDTSNATTSPREDDRSSSKIGSTKRNCVLISTLVLFIIATILAVVITTLHFFYFYPFYGKEYYSQWSSSTPTNNISGKMVKVHMYDVAESKMNMDEAVKYCKEKNMKVITPTTIEETKLFLGQVDKDCGSYYLLGYKADQNYRYRSLDGNTTWKSLVVSSEAANPNNLQECLEISTSAPIRVYKNISCSQTMNVQCILMLKMDIENDCYDHMFHPNCIYRSDETKPFNNVQDGAKSILQLMPKVYGILPLDQRKIPEMLDKYNSYANAKVCYVAAVNYVMKYKSIYDEEQTFRSNHVRVTDPEFDCLGADLRHSKSLITVYCGDPACVMCSD